MCEIHNLVYRTPSPRPPLLETLLSDSKTEYPISESPFFGIMLQIKFPITWLHGGVSQKGQEQLCKLLDSLVSIIHQLGLHKAAIVYTLTYI